MSTVNLDKSEYDALLSTIEAARQETVAVRLELEAERARPVEEKLASSVLYIDASKAVIDYAVGNLSPEFSVNWPLDKMRMLAAQVASVGHVTQRDSERTQIWRTFCDDIAKYERERAARGPLMIEDDDPAIRKMHEDIARGLAGGMLVKDVAPRNLTPWISLVIAVVLCATLLLIARLFLAS